MAMNTTLAEKPISDVKLNDKQMLFILSYVSNGFNATQAIKEAGYTCKRADYQASALLANPNVREEIQARIKAKEDAKIASATEVLQFYTSVMRGQILDQFGIEASLDTRIKAANELAKHQIEIPMKLEQKNITNNIGSIQLNFLPRNPEIV